MMAIRKHPKLQRLVAYATMFPKLRPLSNDIFDVMLGARFAGSSIIAEPVWAISPTMVAAFDVTSALPMSRASGATL
jgi:hypothetical protein